VLDVAKVLAEGVLEGNPLTELTLDDAIMNKALNVNMQPFCEGATTVLANGKKTELWKLPLACSDILPTISIFLSSNPFIGSKAQSDYYLALEPVCSEFEASVASLDAFCKSDSPSLGVAPDNIKSYVINTFSTFFETVDKTLAFIFESDGSKKLAKLLLDVDMADVKKTAASLDNIDYKAFYAKACKGVTNLNFWVMVMLVGAVIHLPAAIGGNHLLNRYSMLMQVQDVHVKTEAGPGAKALI